MIRIGSIVLRVDDLRRQTEFWEAALGYVRRDNGESDDFVLLGPPDGAGPHLSLDQVRSTLQIPPRIHLVCASVRKCPLRTANAETVTGAVDFAARD
jgi:catechol 2,3-dioxygenase-like lactoylglutathione lyase family enzyme